MYLIYLNTNYCNLSFSSGNDELTQSRLEVSTLLAAGDKTHSQLLELMPERSGNAHTRNFEQVLKEVRLCFVTDEGRLSVCAVGASIVLNYHFSYSYDVIDFARQCYLFYVSLLL